MRIVAVWELLPAVLALAAAGLAAWAGAPAKVWGFCLLVSLGLAVIGRLGMDFWTRAR